MWDWGQPETRAKYLAVVDRALATGIGSFFLDKASTSTTNGTQLCNHVCADLSASVGHAWDAGHVEVISAIQAKSPGPTVGNTGFGPCATMGGCTMERMMPANQNSITLLAEELKKPGVKAIFAHFPLSTAGYAAFLMYGNFDMFGTVSLFLFLFPPLPSPCPSSPHSRCYVLYFVSALVGC